MRINPSEAVGHSDPRTVQAGCEKRTSILLYITQDSLKSRGAPQLTSKNPLSFHTANLVLVLVFLFFFFFFFPNPVDSATGGIGDQVDGQGEGNFVKLHDLDGSS